MISLEARFSLLHHQFALSFPFFLLLEVFSFLFVAFFTGTDFAHRIYIHDVESEFHQGQELFPDSLKQSFLILFSPLRLHLLRFFFFRFRFRILLIHLFRFSFYSGHAGPLF